eukprot:gene21337-23412_t
MTVDSGILKIRGEKSYCPYFSGCKRQDQVFVDKVNKEMISEEDLEKVDLMIIKSGNCKGQFKSAEHFSYLQKLSNSTNKQIIHFYGVAVHGKGEVDCVGGLAKVTIWKEVVARAMFMNAADVSEFVQNKFSGKTDPSYVIKSHQLSKTHLRYENNSVALKEDTDIEQPLSFIIPESFVAVAADESSLDPIWFIYVLETGCVVDRATADDYGLIVPNGVPYVKGHFMEKSIASTTKHATKSLRRPVKCQEDLDLKLFLQNNVILMEKMVRLAFYLFHIEAVELFDDDMDSNNEEKGSSKTGTRKRETQCPVKTCRVKRYDLPRHMRKVHNWPDSEAKHVKALYGLRKTYDSQVKRKNPELKNYHVPKACSVEGCRAVVINLPRHLSAVHKVDPKSEEFDILKARAVRMENSKSQKTKVHTGIQQQKSLTLILNQGLIESDSDDSSFVCYTESSSSPSSSSLSECESQKRQPENREEPYASGSFQPEPFIPPTPDIDQYEESTDCDYQESVISDDDLIAEIAVQSPKEEINEIMDSFYNFLVSADSANKDPSLHSSAERGATSFQTRLKTWKSSYMKEVKIKDMAKMENDRRTKITPDHIVKFEQSSIVKETIKFLGILEEKDLEVTQHRFSSVRDLLITEIFIDNGHRAGVLANMTMGEYDNIESKKGHHTITVFKHKEARAGPIRVIMNDKLFGWVKIYIEKVRPTVTDDISSSSKVFLTWNGAPFINSGGISNASTALWKKAGMEGRCGANKFRKAAVSAVRSENPESELIHKDLANLMGHKKSTADRYYHMEEKVQSSDRAAKELPSIMRKCNNSIMEKEGDEKVDQEDEGKESYQQSVANAKRKNFSDGELAVIEDILSSEIEMGSIILSTVLEKIAENSQLQGCSSRRVYDKVRQLCKRKKSAETLALPTDCESLQDRIERMTESRSDKTSHESDEDFLPTTSSSKVKDLFGAKELKLLKDGFKTIIAKRSVREEDVQAAINSNHAAKKLSEIMKVTTIKNRLKYEIRKARAQK